MIFILEPIKLDPKLVPFMVINSPPLGFNLPVNSVHEGYTDKTKTDASFVTSPFPSI